MLIQKIKKEVKTFREKIAKSDLQNRKKVMYAGIVIFSGILIITGYFYFNRDSISAFSQGTPEKHFIAIDKSYTYNLKGSNGDNRGSLTLQVVEAEKTTEVQVKGEKILAPEGSAFLTIKIEWNNESAEQLSLISANYFRYMNQAEKLYAPSFYNEDVSIAPLSVRNDKIAFVVPDNEPTIKIQIGELKGTKEIVELQFSN